ncbi:MAG: hypothetical protein FD167_2566, partial [bacterium]
MIRPITPLGKLAHPRQAIDILDWYKEILLAGREIELVVSFEHVISVVNKELNKNNGI